MSNYELHRRVPIAGMYSKEGDPIVEIGVIQTVPEGQVVLDYKRTSEDSYHRKARIGLSPDEARDAADALNEMANRMEQRKDE